MDKEIQGRIIHTTLPIALILLLSLALNHWGNRWGTPDYWHPDELTGKAIGMYEGGTLIPPTFFYGGLHYYVLEAGAVFPVRVYGKLFDPMPKKSDTANRSKWAERKKIRTIRLGRCISAVMATFQVFLTYLIGNLLFGRTVGLLSSLFLCLSAYFVAISHFATIDTPANFWYWLAFYFALMSWKKDSDAWLGWASITAGLAIGVKIDRVVIIFPLLFSCFVRRDGGYFRKLLKSALLILAGYILANPALLLSPIQYLDGTSRDLFFNMSRSAPGPSSTFLQILSDTKSGMGLLLFLAALGGLGIAARNLLVGKDRYEVAWLLVSIVPFFLLVGSHYPLPWYVPFFFPALVIFAAYGCQEMRKIAPAFFRMAAEAIPAVIVLASLMTSISMNLQISKDSRYLAAEWIEQQIPAGASISVGARGPVISKTKFRLAHLTLYKGYNDWAFVREWLGLLDQNPAYRFIRKSILELEKFMAAVSGRPARKEPYKAWFDTTVERADAVKNESGTDRNSEVEKTDYVVLIDYLDLGRISELMSTNSGYRVIKKFQYRDPFGIQVTFPFVNPEVYVFSRS